MRRLGDKSFMSYWNITDEKTYVCSLNVPGLMKFDWEKESFIPIAMFPENCRDYCAYALNRMYKNKIICFPSYQSKIILFFDIEKNEFRQVDIELNSDEKGAEIFNAYLYNEHYFCVMSKAGRILELNPTSEETVSVYAPESSKYSFIAGVYFNEKIYLTTDHPMEIVVFDVNDKVFKIIKMNEQNFSFRMLVNVGENFILGGYKKEIYKWNLNSSKLDILKLPSWVNDSGRDDYYDYDFFCTDIFIVNDKICFLSLHESGLFVYDGKKDNFDLIRLPEKNKSRKNVKSYTRLYIKDDRFIMLYSLVDERMVEVDIKTGEYKIVVPQIDDKIWKWMSTHELYDYGMGLENFIHLLTNDDIKIGSDKPEKNIGKRIYSFIISK